MLKIVIPQNFGMIREELRFWFIGYLAEQKQNKKGLTY
jgi:hypothetical protein